MSATQSVEVRFSLELETDPLGARLSVAVPSAPSRESREALLDGIQESLIGARGNLVSQAISEAHDQLEAYGSRHDYAVGAIPDTLDFTPSDATRSDRGVTVSWHWTHPAAEFFEFGVSSHRIDGDPLLSFIWTDPPQWVTEEFDAEGDGYRVFFSSVDHPGVPEARWVRDSLNWLRREVGQA